MRWSDHEPTCSRSHSADTSFDQPSVIRSSGPPNVPSAFGPVGRSSRSRSRPRSTSLTSSTFIPTSGADSEAKSADKAMSAAGSRPTTF